MSTTIQTGENGCIQQKQHQQPPARIKRYYILFLVVLPVSVTMLFSGILMTNFTFSNDESLVIYDIPIAELNLSEKFSPVKNYNFTQESTVFPHHYSMHITQRHIETYQARLPSLLSQFRNPCWIEEVPAHYDYSNNYYNSLKCFNRGERQDFTFMQRVLQQRCKLTNETDELQGQGRIKKCWRIRCYPYFFVLGAPKAGTTDLYSSLALYHPQVIPNSRKESQFWPRYRFGLTDCNTGNATFSDYIDLYDRQAEQITSRSVTVDGRKYYGDIVGEYTPANYYYHYKWQTWEGNQNQSEPKVILAHQLYHIRPQTKFIFNVREPVARAISNYYFNKPKAPILQYFTGLITMMDHCLLNNSLRWCVYSQKNSLTIGMYYVFIKDWVDVFPRDQIFVLLLEEYMVDRAKTVDQISDFLGIDHLPASAVSAINKADVKLKGKKNKNVPEKLEQMLRDFYAPWNRKLAEFLRDDKYLWGY